jgi:ribosome-binding factor A
MAILADLKDPRIEGVTVTYVEVSGDMRMATVHVSIMGDSKAQELCLHGLRSSAGYLQKKLSRRIDTRYTPRLRFELDMGVKKSIEIAKMLHDVLPDVASPEAPLLLDPSETGQPATTQQGSSTTTGAETDGAATPGHSD